MTARRLLFLNSAQLTAYRWHTGRLTVEGVFPPDETGQEAFAEYLLANRRSVFHLLADVADEGFQIEDVPHVRGRDRSALVERKLGQYFYGTALSAAFSLGRDTEGRRDEKILFAALTRPQQFEPWLSALRRAESRLAGIYSVPQTVAGLAKELGKAHQRLLLVSVTHGGLRQTFVQNGRLHFSRLTPLATDTTEEMAIAANVESVKMCHYLAGQRLITRGTPLHTAVLVHPDQQAAFRQHCVDTDELRFQFLDLQDEARRHGLKSPPRDSRADTLFLHLLQTNPPSQQFAPTAERRFFHIWQAQSGLRSAGLVVLAACLLLAARQGATYLGVAGATAEMQAALQSDRQRYDNALQALPKIPISTDNLRALIDRYDQANKLATGPEPAYLLLGRALKDSPKIDLERLEWRITRNPEGLAKPGGAPAPGKAPAARTAAPPPVQAAYAAIEVHGLLPISMATDHRAQIELVNAFADRLRAEHGVQVSVLTMPFETESGKALKSGGEGTAAAEAPK
ncbi:MAG TPA: hypothetical protein VMB75_08300, partial [Rhodocyclaceae bacterium]|nr:hypothetical protein [Rhodocyclaceae bacterium]